MIKKIFISILSVVVLLFVADRLIGKVLWNVNQRSKNMWDVHIRQSIDLESPDILLLGASRTNHHFVPSIIEDSLNMPTFNAGVDGAGNIFYQYATLNYALEHYRPKIISLEMGFKLLNGNFDHLTYYAPYVGRNAAVDTMFTDLGLLTGFNLSHIYRFNVTLIRNLFGVVGGDAYPTQQGYIPLECNGGASMGEIPHTKQHHEIDTLAMKYLDKFVKLCKDNDIKLVFCMSPLYSIPLPDQYDFIKDYANKNGILFFDYNSDLSYLNDKTLWKDESHLCEEGSIIFTQRFAHDLKEALKQ